MAGPDSEREAEARRILRQIKGETDPTGIHSRRSVLERTGDHFAGRDAPDGDRIELWGRRIGRTLSLVLFVGLVFWLIRFAASLG